jgi:hypothetical protein
VKEMLLLFFLLCIEGESIVRPTNIHGVRGSSSHMNSTLALWRMRHAHREAVTTLRSAMIQGVASGILASRRGKDFTSNKTLPEKEQVPSLMTGKLLGEEHPKRNTNRSLAHNGHKHRQSKGSRSYDPEKSQKWPVALHLGLWLAAGFCCFVLVALFFIYNVRTRSNKGDAREDSAVEPGAG